VWESPVLQPLAQRLRASVRFGEIGVLTVLALVAYVWIGFWMRDDLHFFLGDAMARTSDAVFITVGRDPHMGAIGFFWPPLPQLIQGPFVPFLRPFGRPDLAGPLSSAVCMALTIPVLARLCNRLALSRRMRFCICAAFALNPLIIYYASNGMSEACSILFIAIAMLGFLTFIRTRSTPDLIILTVGLCGAVLTRLEAPLLVAVLAALAAFQWGRWRQSLWTATVIALPPAVCFLVWMAIQWALLGTPLFFVEQKGGVNPRRAIWLPDTVDHPLSAFPWALHWTIVFGPALVAVAILLVWNPLGAGTRGMVGILAGTSVFVGIQIYQVITHTGFGDPRYFMTAVLFATVGACWLASVRPSALRGAWNLCLIGLLILGSVTGPRALSSGRLTRVEGECAFFKYGAAKVLPFLVKQYPKSSADYCAPVTNQLAAWQRLDALIDRSVTPRDRILADNYSNYYAVLFTHKPNQFVVRNDRDWQRIVANPTPLVTYIVTTGNFRSAGISDLPDAGEDAGAAIVRGNPTQWKLVAAFPNAASFLSTTAIAELYKYVGP
jgi:hypothetical protein